MRIFLLLLLSLSAALGSYKNHVAPTEEEFQNYILQQRSFDVLAFDGIHKLIKNFIQYIKDMINSLLNELQEKLAKIFTKIIAVVDKFKSKLKYGTVKAETEIQKLKEKGGIYQECAEKNEIELNEVKNKTNERLNQCSDKYVQALKNYEKNIKDNVTKLEKQIEQLRLAVVTCIHLNPFKTAKCLLERLGKYKQKIENILFGVVDAVKNAAVEGTATVSGVQNCTQNAINDAVVEIDEIQNKLHECTTLTTTTSTTSTTTTSTTSTTSTTTITTTTENPDTTTNEIKN